MFDVNAHLIQLKDKNYLQVMWRLVWFREDHPLWGINTKLIDHDSANGHAVFYAEIHDEEGRLKSAAHGSEGVKDFRDYIEKAETKAVGRALAMLGYGTQFAPELDEGERIVDSPVAKEYTCEVCGKPFADTIVKGKKFTAKDLHDGIKRKYGQAMCEDCVKLYKEMKGAGKNA